MYRDDNRSLPPLRGFELARRRAEAGDCVAMLAMYMAYRSGMDGFGRDLEAADEWLRRANARCRELAEAGDPEAMATWADLLLEGRWHVPQDEAAGVRWFFRAAEAARVHRAPGRTTTAGPNNNQPPRQESTAQEQPTAQ